MQSQQITDKLEITGLANKLFMYTDNRQWQKLLDEVFAEQVMFDMSSAGGAPPQNMAARDICEMWRQGFEPLDGVHHQAGHYLINITKDEAEIFGYAVAIHYKKMAKKGNTRTFVGRGLSIILSGWMEIPLWNKIKSRMNACSAVSLFY